MKGATLSVLAVLVLIAQIAPAACADTPRALSPTLITPAPGNTQASCA